MSKNSLRIVLGIPARLASNRLPRKPLRKILDMPMVEHVYKRCSLSKYSSELFVAACDSEVKNVVESFGGKVIMTDPTIPRPGLRVAVAAEALGLNDEDIVVVVQGDEPLIHPDMIDLAIEPLLSKRDIFVSNLARPVDEEEEWQSPNTIHVVTDLQMNALYMSRNPIPSTAHEEDRGPRLKQVCVMPFRWHFMRKFNALPPTPLEKAESIEMIRAIQHGCKVRMVMSPFNSKSVDTEEDLEIVEKLMGSDPLWPKYR